MHRSNCQSIVVSLSCVPGGGLDVYPSLVFGGVLVVWVFTIDTTSQYWRSAVMHGDVIEGAKVTNLTLNTKKGDDKKKEKFEQDIVCDFNHLSELLK